MKRIKKWRQQAVRHFFETLFLWLAPPYDTQVVQDQLPNQLKNRMLYIVKDDGLFEQAAMLCPCGCNRVLHMNLLPDEHPYWHLTQYKDGTASLYPSVWRKMDCQSHFWFLRSRVHWFREKNEESQGS